ncbi:MAG: riboflavin synthase [Opitutales bacterium]|nr:riboflavin synthase [Opitutales bacterium]
MFTGLVEGTAKVAEFSEQKNAYLLRLEIPKDVAEDLKIGDSLACNGCCLTVVSKTGNIADFELLQESLRLTSFEFVKKGDLVNVERPLAANARLGGHFVSGHIDTRGKMEVFEQRGKNYYLKVSFPEGFGKWAVYKGSVTIDGISLTIAEVENNSLAVWIIPHTLQATNLSQKKAGDIVNLEFDILAKYVEKIAICNRQ